jgi:hypothetical protein
MKVEIIYPSGRMTINLENFFPASFGNLKKLLKIIDMDRQHKDQIISDIVSWMNEEIKNNEDTAKAYANKYVEIHPQVREASTRVETMENMVSGLKGTQAHKLATDGLKETKREYNRLKGLEISYNRAFKQYFTRKEKLKKNLVMLS